MPATSAERAPTSCQCRRNNLKGVISASLFSTWVHYQRKAGAGSSRLGPFSCPYSAECVEGVFSELRIHGVLRSSDASTFAWLVRVEGQPVVAVGHVAMLLVGGISLAQMTRSTAPERPYYGPLEGVFTLATVLTFSVVGAIVASRQPRN